MALRSTPSTVALGYRSATAWLAMLARFVLSSHKYPTPEKKPPNNKINIMMTYDEAERGTNVLTLDGPNAGAGTCRSKKQSAS